MTKATHSPSKRKVEKATKKIAQGSKNNTEKAKKAIFSKAILRKIKKIFKRKPVIAVIRLAGVISSHSGLKPSSTLNLENLEDSIEKAFSLGKLKAVALQVNSPGGSPAQSELIYNHIRRFAAEKKVPVYAFAEDAAASGGYWLLCAGDELYALPGSIIGSIGVITSGFGFVEAINKIGIERRVYTQGENKSILDPFMPEKKKDVEFLYGLQKELHEVFKNMVRERRKGKIKKEDENTLFSGQFWVGTQAKDFGLVDNIGDMHTIMREKYGKKIKFIKITKARGLLFRKMGIASQTLVTEFLGAIEERLHWLRLGL